MKKNLLPRRSIGLRLFAVFALLFVALTASAQIHVTPNGGISTQDGTSWETAYPGTALPGVLSNPANLTVLVASGLYKPTTTGDRTQSFTIASGVQVYGGYDPSSGNRTTNPSSTTLSGDIDNNNTLDDGNSYHVVRFYGANDRTCLDGFVITGGKANGSGTDGWGGGILNLELTDPEQPSDPTIAHCTFTQNSAAVLGGAMMNKAFLPGSNPIITYCDFIENKCDDRGGAIFNDRTGDPDHPIVISHCTFTGNIAPSGGALYNNSAGGGTSNARVSDCTFSQNYANLRGGAIYNSGASGGISNPRIERCDFSLNKAEVHGGAIVNDGEGGTCSPTIISCRFSQNEIPSTGRGFVKGAAAIQNNGRSGNSNPVITNCSFTKNRSIGWGAAMYADAENGGRSTPVITNCSFSQNSGKDNIGVIFVDCGGPFTQIGIATFINCVLFDNGTNPIDTFYGVVIATNSLFDAPYAYTTDPTNLTTTTSPFVDADNENLQPVACSLPVNAGNNSADGLTGITTDLAGNPRFVNTIDMGAYEFQGVTITGQPASASAVCAGSSVSVPVSATGVGSLTYQWFKDGSPLNPAQTSATLSLTNVQAAQEGSYQVVITSTCNSLTSNAFSLTLTSSQVAPVISLPPNISLPVLQNTPFVALTVSGCEGGTLSWQGPGGVTGSSTTISVPTATTGTLVYSATCTVGSCTSPPGSTTVTISPSLVSGSFDGFVNGADCSTFRGWAWDRNKVNTPVSVDILDGPNVIATVLADVFRQDLQTAGKGNGKHAFSWPIPASLKDGLPHNLSARVAGSSFILKDSPKALICVGTGTPENKAPVAPSPTVLIAPLAAQVGVPFSGTLVAFTDPEGQPLMYALSGLPDGLTINMTNRVISGIPTVAGNFVLTYSANDGVLTNSVSFPLTVNPASTTTVTGSFEGYLDKVECGTIRGWVWDRNKPNTPVTVEIYSKTAGGVETIWGSTVANIFRQDLKDAGKGNGVHAYSFEVPSGLKDGNQRIMYGRVLGSTYALKDSGKPLTCNAPTRLSAETGSALQVTVLGNPVSDQVEVEIRGGEGQQLHLQLTDASGRLVGQRQAEVAKPVEHQRFSVSGQAAGLLLLRVNSGLKTVTVKVLKH
ncbi:immunoglobulin domain-containing protein [Larkinella rosea]|uniref:Ig-like domain-containing protein n=1 Tax=Larkinella rosea TaxID=2025312 RepID=A0A3P1BAP4_9BACT|nr:immunoglobulin domain-containing protein [Larkinella rosea]RRA98069.1 hypothetical protein EHT25_30840 [Larkinella rosea]